MDIQCLRADHRVIVQLTAALGGCAEGFKTRADAEEIDGVLGQLDRRLSDHLAVEDSWLYPTLSGSADAAVRDAALKASEDLLGLRGVWALYRARWSAEAMMAAPDAFRAATRALAMAIAFRVEHEEAVLYPIAAKLEAEKIAE